MSAPVCRLGDQTTIIMGQSPPGDSYNKEHAGVPLLNGPTEFGPIHPTEKQWTTAPTKLCEPGDALFCVRGATAGRLNVADKTYCLGRGLAAIRGKPGKFDAGFLLHILRNGYAKFQARGVGSTFINISSEELSQFEVPALPLTEQRRIAEVLDRAEALRAKRHAALAQLDTLTQSIFLGLFGDPTLPEPTIGELLESGRLLLHKDGNHGSLYPCADDFGDEGVPFLSAKAVTDDGVIDNTLVENLREEKAATLTIGWICKGDVLLAHNASVGKVALYDGRFERALIGTSLTAFRPKPEALDSLYLAAALRSVKFQRQLERNMGQTTRNQVPITAQRRLRILEPPISLQREFSHRIGAVEKLKATYRASLAELDTLFASLQYRAFRGEL